MFGGCSPAARWFQRKVLKRKGGKRAGACFAKFMKAGYALLDLGDAIDEESVGLGGMKVSPEGVFVRVVE
jgi:hypothetical protein